MGEQFFRALRRAAGDDERAAAQLFGERPNLRDDASAEDNAPGGGKFKIQAHELKSSANKFWNFTLERGVVIIGATVSRHAA